MGKVLELGARVHRGSGEPVGGLLQRGLRGLDLGVDLSLGGLAGFFGGLRGGLLLPGLLDGGLQWTLKKRGEIKKSLLSCRIAV